VNVARNVIDIGATLSKKKQVSDRIAKAIPVRELLEIGLKFIREGTCDLSKGLFDAYKFVGFPLDVKDAFRH
jgi:hypothetical protein